MSGEKSGRSAEPCQPDLRRSTVRTGWLLPRPARGAAARVRDEVRHIGIGVSYARQRLGRDRPHARAVIEEIVEGFQLLGHSLLDTTDTDLDDQFVNAYGADPATLWAAVLHQLHLRLRSIGLSDIGRKTRPVPHRLDPAN